MFKVMVLGHSFVKRAKDFVHSGLEDTTDNLHLEDVDFHWNGFGGLTLPLLELKSHLLYATRPDILVLDIGSNDLCDDFIDPHALALNVYNVANSFLHVSSITCIFILDISYRSIQSSYSARQDFNACADIYNSKLHYLCSSNIAPIFPASLRGLKDNFEDYLHTDGVHLSVNPHPGTSHSGTFKYLMSVRRAVVNGVHYCMHHRVTSIH